MVIIMSTAVPFLELINEPDKLSCNYSSHMDHVFVTMHLEHLRKWNQQLTRQLKIVTARCEFLQKEFVQLQHDYEILQSESILKDNEIRRLKDDNFLLEFRLQTEHDSLQAATPFDKSSEFDSDLDWSDTDMRRVLSQGSLTCCHDRSHDSLADSSQELHDRSDDSRADPSQELHDGKDLGERLHRDIEDQIFEETCQDTCQKSADHVKGVSIQFVDHKNGMVS